MPLTRTLFADAETPVGVYRKLAADRPGTFLLESAEPGRSFSRWSFVGVNAVATLSARAGEAVWSGQVPDGVPTDGDPLEVLGAAWRALRGPRLPGLPPLTGGLVGYLAYDVVRRIETLPQKAEDDLGLPGADHAARHRPGGRGPPRVLRDAHRQRRRDAGMSDAELDAAYADAHRRLDRDAGGARHAGRADCGQSRAAPPKQAVSRTPPGEYQRAVEQALEAVRAGEVFQISARAAVRGATPTPTPFDVYRVLRTLNPSPYMYVLRLDGFDIVGSSPEALVTVQGGLATIHPIAGTRRRGDTPERDAALVAELVDDPKERAEHVMLVDLARNDLGRVCEAGSVKVVEFGVVERYSHVWHIVSTVTGEVADGLDALDVLQAAFPPARSPARPRSGRWN